MSAEGVGVVNDAEFRVFGLKRSGHHAVINWLLAQSSGDSYFMGDVSPHSNPYLTFYDFEHWHQGERVYREGLYSPEGVEAFTRGPYGLGARWRTRQKSALVYNYEDQPIGDILDAGFRRQLVDWVGPSGRRYNVLVLRDPFNFFASRMRAGDRLAAHKSDSELIALWKEHADWYWNPPIIEGEVNIGISFSRWHSSRVYRRDIARRMALDFTDAGRREVSPYMGSSFDGFDFDGAAEQMSVDRRWEAFQQSGLFALLRADSAMMRRTSEIFGDIPAIQEAMTGHDRGLRDGRR